MRNILNTLTLLFFFTLSHPVSAGEAIQGNVITYISLDETVLVAAMNNRYSTNPYSRVYAYGVPGGVISISARDDYGNYFSCVVSQTSDMYDDARILRTTMGESAIIQARRLTDGTSYCTYLNIQTDSRYLH